MNELFDLYMLFSCYYEFFIVSEIIVSVKYIAVGTRKNKRKPLLLS